MFAKTGQTSYQVDEALRRRVARLTGTAWQGWDLPARATHMARPSFPGLTEALGQWLHEHDGRLWELTEAECRDLLNRALEIDIQRRTRYRR